MHRIVRYEIVIGMLRTGDTICKSVSRVVIGLGDVSGLQLNRYRLITTNWNLVGEIQWSLNQSTNMSFKKMYLNMKSAKQRLFHSCLSVIIKSAWMHNWGCFIRFNVQFKNNYRKVSNIRRTLVGIKIVDHSDVVGASPVGAAPNTSSFST